jgi:phosphatidylcholine synthase
MKTDDNYFRGFPALWNLAAFYLYVLRPSEWVATAFILALAILSFVPIRFVHPMRVRHLRPLNIALLVVWAGLALDAVVSSFAPDPYVTWALVFIAVYFFVAGLLRPAQAR